MSEIDLDEASLRDLVMVNDGQVVTTSLKVAERFGKRHDNVLRAIDNLDCSAGFRLLNFEETVMWRENPSGGEPIKSRSFDMTKDGFMFLVMGFRVKPQLPGKKLSSMPSTGWPSSCSNAQWTSTPCATS